MAQKRSSTKGSDGHLLFCVERGLEEDSGLMCWGTCAQRGLQLGRESYLGATAAGLEVAPPQEERPQLRRGGGWVPKGFQGWGDGSRPFCPSDLFPRNLGTSWGLSPCAGMGVRGSAFPRGWPDERREPRLPAPVVFASKPLVFHLPTRVPDGCRASVRALGIGWAHQGLM